ncbi:MAG: radical SAM family heme chaperone HemW, partial [Cyclobacteriaceae bacterium]|nr:radical SAM family heme chaperone HemW [Cyclobacteriaceae bacterium]
LKPEALASLLDTIYKFHAIVENPEITLEVNPDDVNKELLKRYKQLGVNRLSIGIQTFNDDLLRYVNRQHSSGQSVRALNDARLVGFQNINADIIYGIPGSSKNNLENDLKKILSFKPEHISIYGFTLEEKTVFGKWAKSGNLPVLEEDTEAILYEYIINTLPLSGYDHYEISNFCLEGYESRHNSGYWSGQPYIGIGPGAHSYQEDNRWWNISNNHRYMQSLQENMLPSIYEERKPHDSLNEYIFTSLRTKWGCDIKKINKIWKKDFMVINQNYIQYLIEEKLAKLKEHHLILSNRGKLLADQIAAELMVD